MEKITGGNYDLNIDQFDLSSHLNGGKLDITLYKVVPPSYKLGYNPH